MEYPKCIKILKTGKKMVFREVLFKIIFIEHKSGIFWFFTGLSLN